MTTRKLETILSIFIVFFLLVSIAILIPDSMTEKPQNRSNALEQRTIKEGNIERTDYLDKNGIITMAADRGYATMIRTFGESYGIEHFYNEKGEPICIYPGYYALYREYDQEGRNYRIIYLDQEDKPVITKEGYSEKYLTFYDMGKIKSEKYYDTEGNPVFTSTYGYGLFNEYNEEGEKYKTTYLDKEDHPVVVGLGYAIIRRNYYKSEGPENGKTESEFYYDENEEPKALSLGQYGVHKEYDITGLEVALTYLNAEGFPIVTNKGYTTVTKTYHANNMVATEQYYDIEGKPFSLAEGQYGIRNEDDQLTYLDQNGKEIFNLKRLLYNLPWIIIPAGLFVIILSILLNRKLNIILLLFYIAAILYMTLIHRESTARQMDGLFQHYRSVFFDNESRMEILRNIWLFIPLGAILYRIHPKFSILLISVGISILIETIQYFLGLGFCEPDDIISNGLGGAIGYGMGCHTKMIRDLILREKTDYPG